jgi:ATP-dependent DNA helicase RecQ
VAITRTRRRAVVLADAERPSPFLAEMDGTAPKRTGTGTGTGTGARPPAPRGGERPSAPPREAAALDPADQAVYDTLRAWRRERAKTDGVPAYVVLQDTHMHAIARARPRAMDDLARCPGMGAKRLELYGDAILAILDGVSF